MDHLLNYRIPMYPGSRERLELELERDKRERDAREREIREREIRDMEMREKMEMKAPGLERLLPPHGPNPMDPQWLEFQRRYGNLPPGALGHHGGPSGSHIPGVYPPSSIASDLMQRERERLERLDILRSDQMTGRMIYQICTQRLTNEQIYMQRVTNECILRSKHEWGAGGVIDPAASQLVYQFNRADPLAVSAASGTPSHLPSLPPGLPLHAGLLSREQEMLQNEFYRRAYADPGLAHQLSAQAAQHEAIQRQLAMERERFGHMPPH